MNRESFYSNKRRYSPILLDRHVRFSEETRIQNISRFSEDGGVALKLRNHAVSPAVPVRNGKDARLQGGSSSRKHSVGSIDRRNAIKIVLKEYKLQTKRGRMDTMHLADMYRECCQQNRMRAYIQGIADEKEAKLIRSDIGV